MPPLEQLRVGHSRIHGYGVFTCRSFAKGETVIVGDGMLWREHEEFDDEYALILPGYERTPDGEEGPPLYYDLTDQTRWINHSCDPNTEVDSRWDPVAKSVTAFWYALRDIAVGEELSYDYAFSGHLAIPCQCAAAKCRGVIVDADELGDVPRKYRHLIRPPIAATARRRPPARRAAPARKRTA
jgi:SET domain-containing protein